MRGKQLRKAYFEAYFEFGLITEHSCGDVLENPEGLNSHKTVK